MTHTHTHTHTNTNVTRPERMTPEQRRAELATLLAHALVRLRSAVVAPCQIAATERALLLGFCGEQSVDTHRTQRAHLVHRAHPTHH